MNLFEIIEQQIKKEVEKRLKGFTPSQPFSAYVPPAKDTELAHQKIENLMFPAFVSMFAKRLASGCEPIKQSPNTLYISQGFAIFSEENSFIVNPITIEIPSFTEDRWVWVYLKDDGTFITSKYAPVIGDNVDYIPICKIWKEHDSTDFDNKTLRDLRPVGFAPSSIWHVLRQQFLNLYLGLPKVFLNNINITPANQPSLDIQIGSNGDSILYSRLNPIPDTVLTIPYPPSGVNSIDYYIIASAQVDNYDPNDFQWNFKTKSTSETLEEYEIPLAVVRGITSSTSEISSDMIETLGYQNKREDYFSYDMNFSLKLDNTVSHNYTITGYENILFIDASVNSVTIYLPSALSLENKMITLKALNVGSGNTIDILPVSGESIDGLSSITLNDYESVRLYSNGRNWYKI